MTQELEQSKCWKCGDWLLGWDDVCEDCQQWFERDNRRYQQQIWDDLDKPRRKRKKKR